MADFSVVNIITGHRNIWASEEYVPRSTNVMTKTIFNTN